MACKIQTSCYNSDNFIPHALPIKDNDQATLYDIFSVSRHADSAIIKATHKVLAQKYHHDKNPNDPHAQEIIQAINHAYEILSNPAKRTEYDRYLDAQEAKKQVKQQATERTARQAQPRTQAPSQSYATRRSESSRMATSSEFSDRLRRKWQSFVE